MDLIPLLVGCFAFSFGSWRLQSTDDVALRATGVLSLVAGLVLTIVSLNNIFENLAQ